MIVEQRCANCGNSKWFDGVTAITSTCTECKYVDKGGSPQLSNWIPKVQTNADCIRSMSDEELAWFLAKEATRIAKPVFDYCGIAVNEEVIFLSRLLWLQEPAEECE